jgi:hypothetical protein
VRNARLARQTSCLNLAVKAMAAATRNVVALLTRTASGRVVSLDYPGIRAVTALKQQNLRYPGAELRQDANKLHLRAATLTRHPHLLLVSHRNRLQSSWCIFTARVIAWLSALSCVLLSVSLLPSC